MSYLSISTEIHLSHFSYQKLKFFILQNCCEI